MIGHQNIGVNRTALGRLPQPTQKRAPAFVIEEHVLTIVATLQQMMGVTRQ
jgi:hypothetical protein